MVHDETVRDDDIINYITRVTGGQQEPGHITADKIHARLQLCQKLECRFLAIDANSERTLKFQKGLHFAYLAAETYTNVW